MPSTRAVAAAASAASSDAAVDGGRGLHQVGAWRLVAVDHECRPATAGVERPLQLVDQRIETGRGIRRLRTEERRSVGRDGGVRSASGGPGGQQRTKQRDRQHADQHGPRRAGGSYDASVHRWPPSPADLRSLPKAELHQHLDGALRPATAVELAAEIGLPLTQDEAQARMVAPARCRDQAELLTYFDLPIALLQTSGCAAPRGGGAGRGPGHRRRHVRGGALGAAAAPGAWTVGARRARCGGGGHGGRAARQRTGPPGRPDRDRHALPSARRQRRAGARRRRVRAAGGRLRPGRPRGDVPRPTACGGLPRRRGRRPGTDRPCRRGARPGADSGGTGARRAPHRTRGDDGR